MTPADLASIREITEEAVSCIACPSDVRPQIRDVIASAIEKAISRLEAENQQLRSLLHGVAMGALQRLNYDLDLDFRELVDEAIEATNSQPKATQ